MNKLLRYLTGPVLLLALVGGGIWFYRSRLEKSTTVNFRTAAVELEEIYSSIAATGTVEPEELVNVGAQVGGMITEFGPDVTGKRLDYGSVVKAGGILAKIDDSLYNAEFKQCEAAVQQSAAAILQADAQIAGAAAGIKQAEAKLSLAKLNFERSQRLRPTGVIAQSDYETYQSTYDAAVAEIDSCKAQYALAEAQKASAVAQKAAAEANLARARYNLRYCVITSPVDGVIIDRRVNIGQTVVSSMSAPSLFLIAKDLRKMQLWVTVNEADVGSIRPGLAAWFTVDAFPRRQFEGTVQKVRLNATMSQNVVTYVIEVGTDNSDGVLLPYLTANVKFILEYRKAALTVPNAALRFTPDASLPDAPPPEPGPGEKLLWVLEPGNRLKPVAVTVGLNSGMKSEITGGDLRAGDLVITAAELSVISGAVASGADKSGSPFIPTPPRRGGQRRK